MAQFSGGLANTCRARRPQAEPPARPVRRLGHGVGPDDDLVATAPVRSRPASIPASLLELDLPAAEITTVCGRPGFRPDYSWLDVPVLDRKGRIRHDGGVVPGAPGLYVLGLPVLRTRASTYIHGASADSDALASHLHTFLSSRPR